MLLLDILTHPILWLGAAVIAFAHFWSGFGDWLLFVSLLFIIFSGEFTLARANHDCVIVEVRVKVNDEWYVLAKKKCKFDVKCEYYTQFSPSTLRLISLFSLLADVKIFVQKTKGKWDIVSAP